MEQYETEELESVVDDYLDDMEVARRKVCSRIEGMVRENPYAREEILYLLARGVGGELALEVTRYLKRRVPHNAEEMEARADLYRKYEAVVVK